jgi:SAM-dependent methyltransferase
MQTAHLQELVDLEDTYWWHVAKRDLVLQLLAKHAPAPGKLIEGGVGSARNLLAFRDAGYDVSGFDLMPEAVLHARSRGVESVEQHDLVAAWPVKPNSVKAVVLLDVIEHVEFPTRVLSHAREALQTEGVVIVTVPAYQWLYSDWDEALGHYRRYTKRALRDQARQAGLKTVRITHWNSFTLPAAVAVRTAQKLVPANRPADFPRVSPFANRMLTACADVERWWLKVAPVPCGLSIVGVFTK